MLRNKHSPKPTKNHTNSTPTSNTKQPQPQHYKTQQQHPTNHIHNSQMQSQNKSLSWQQQASSSRLDLIFKKQPRQIQEKLMKLLIHYNALMQYNVETNMFEVDLLLPFVSQSEKAEFIRQFLSIRKNTNHILQQQKQNESFSMSKSEHQKDFEEIRKFSFNNNNSFELTDKEDPFQQSHNANNNPREFNIFNQPTDNPAFEDYSEKATDQHHQNNRSIKTDKHKDTQFQIKIEDEEEINSQEKKHQKVNYIKLRQTINFKLNKAIKSIRQAKLKSTTLKLNKGQSKTIMVEEQAPHEQESIIHQLSSNSFHNTLKSNDSKHINPHQFIRQDIDDDQLFQESSQTHQSSSFSDHYKSHYHQFQQTIFEQQEQEDMQPLFNQQKLLHKHPKNVTSFEEYTKKYTSVKQQQRNKAKTQNVVKSEKKKVKVQKGKAVQVEKRYWSSKQKKQKSVNDDGVKMQGDQSRRKMYQTVSYKQKERVQDKNMNNSHSNSRPKSNKSPSRSSSQALRQNVHDFFDSHKQNLNKIYREIQNKINQREKVPLDKIQKTDRSENDDSLQDLFILILDEQEEESNVSQPSKARQFKTHILEDYQKEIIVNNRTLSSEDLIKYFKYLHFHAKKLYLKYINNKPK